VLVSADGTQTPVSVFPCSSTGCVSTPMSRGKALETCWAPVQYAGPQTQYPELDQVNVVIPPGLAGADEVPVVPTEDGQTRMW
jgi:uncharacterized protein (TIGR03437 family)